MINIRTIQHYMYCPRRFGLLEINRDWAENAFVVKANILHNNVHSGKHKHSGSTKIELSSIAVYNDELDIYGVIDCVEFIKLSNGVYIEGLDNKYSVNIIEYKPTQPKTGAIRETDAIQVYAQKVCADYLWKCNSNGYIYYCDTRKRVRLPFDEEKEKYSSTLNKLTTEMKQIMESGIIPDRKRGQKCSGCSIQDICIPQNKPYSVRSIIEGDI